MQLPLKSVAEAQNDGVTKTTSKMGVCVCLALETDESLSKRKNVLGWHVGKKARLAMNTWVPCSCEYFCPFGHE